MASQISWHAFFLCALLPLLCLLLCFLLSDGGPGVAGRAEGSVWLHAWHHIALSRKDFTTTVPGCQDTATTLMMLLPHLTKRKTHPPAPYHCRESIDSSHSICPFPVVVADLSVSLFVLEGPTERKHLFPSTIPCQHFMLTNASKARPK